MTAPKLATPVGLADLEERQTPHGPVLVGRDTDSNTWVAESAGFPHPQRGRTGDDAVDTLVGLLDARARRTGLAYSTIRERYFVKGWDAEKAVGPRAAWWRPKVKGTT